MTGSKRYNRNYSESSSTFTDVFLSSFVAELPFCWPVLLDASSHGLNLVLEVSQSTQLVDQAFVLVSQCSDISTDTLAPKV